MSGLLASPSASASAPSLFDPDAELASEEEGLGLVLQQHNRRTSDKEKQEAAWKTRFTWLAATVAACTCTLLLSALFFSAASADVAAPPVSPPVSFRYQTALVSMMQNEERWLPEWLEYHLLIGIEHFLIYDHASTDRTPHILQEYVQRGLLTYVRLEPGKPVDQVTQQNAGLDLLRGVARWVFQLDSDEFFVPRAHSDVRIMLRDYEDFCAVGVNWQMFGTGRVDAVRDDQLALEQLQWKGAEPYSENVHVKSVFQALLVDRMVNQHAAVCKAPYVSVDTSRRPLTHEPWFRQPPLLDTAQINHYFMKDERFTREVKIQRRRDSADFMRLRLTSLNHERDTRILRFLPLLRERLHKQPVDEALVAKTPEPYSEEELQKFLAITP